MTPEPLRVSTVDYHTAGEPFRIITGGVDPLQGDSILDKRRFAHEKLDHIRKLLIYEPRGHADMYGCHVVPPNDAGADIGVVFFHNAGYSTACGHGTIALVTWAIESGYLPAPDDDAVVVDVPSGRLTTTIKRADHKVTSVRFTNVPSFVWDRDVKVQTSKGEVSADISFGGAFYANVAASDVGLKVRPSDLDEFIALGRQIKADIEQRMDVAHPLEPELRDVYGTVFFEDVEPGCQRNLTIFADGEVDRSPCGSGTSARLATLHARGAIQTGQPFRHLSILDTEFQASVVGVDRLGDYDAVITEVEGSASLTGFHEFVLEDDDAIGTGFLLR